MGFIYPISDEAMKDFRILYDAGGSVVFSGEEVPSYFDELLDAGLVDKRYALANGVGRTYVALTTRGEETVEKLREGPWRE